MRITAIILIVLGFLLSSCRDDFYYSQTFEIENNTWNVEDIKEFNFEIKDTSQTFIWFIDVRHTGDFEFANFYVFPKRVAPNGKTYTDTLNIPLADPSGKWYGKGMGSIKDNRVLWKKNVKFPQEGNYKFTLEQGSREKALEGISNIGFSMYMY